MILAVVAQPASAGGSDDDQALQETRYCGAPRRNAAGQIIRRVAVREAFMRAHPCPANGATTGPCPGWQADHVIPLACGGCDAVNNLQWLPVELKTAAKIGKDRFERKIYGVGLPDTGACPPPSVSPETSGSPPSNPS